MDHQVILGSERSEKVDHRNTFGSIVLGILVAIPAFAVITVASGDLDWGAAIVVGVFSGTVGGGTVSSMRGPSWEEMSQLDETIDRISAGERDEETLTQFRQQVRGVGSNSRDASEPVAFDLTVTRPSHVSIFPVRPSSLPSHARAR